MVRGLKSFALVVFCGALTLVAAGCHGHAGEFIAPPLSSGSGNVALNGTTAVLPTPTSLPYTTALSMTNAEILDGTMVTVSGGTALPSNLPQVKFRQSTPAVARQAAPPSTQLLEYVAITPSRHVVGVDGLTMTVSVPASRLAPAGFHYWAMLCLTDLGDNDCKAWDGPFGPATVNTSGSTANVSVLVPIPVFPGGGTHTVAIYAVPDGTAISQAPQSDYTSFVTKENDPTGKTKDLAIHFSVNGGASTPWTANGLAYGNASIGQNGSNEPLDVSEQQTWTKDLPLIRGMGANAIRVYNASPNAPAIPPSGSLSLDQFLTAAYLGSGNPQNVYVILGSMMGAPGNNPKTKCSGTTYTPSPANGGGLDYLSCYEKTTYVSWVTYYTWLARHYGGNPAVLGFTLGNEINTADDEVNAGFWKQLSNMTTAIRNAMLSKGYKGQKLVFFSAVNDMNTPTSGATVAMAKGENIMQTVLFPTTKIGGFDVWGYDVYDGPQFGCATGNCFFTDVQSYTSRPVTFLEFGAQASYHPTPGATPTPMPPANVIAIPLPHVTASPDAYPCTSAFPITSLPTMEDVVTFYGCGQVNLDQYNVSAGAHGAADVMSGGFVFEFIDEFFKQGGGVCLYFHCASTANSGYLQTENSNGNLFYDDEAYLGLMSVGYGGVAHAPAPAGSGTDTRTPRETYCWFQNHWTGTFAAPCQAQVRFVNGTVGASTASLTWSIDGASQSPVAQQAISAYAVLPAGPPRTHTVSYGSGSCQTPALLASSRTTVVLAGNSSMGYSCQIFDEPEVTNTGVYAVFHNAAAAYASATSNALYPYASYALPGSAGGNPLQYPTGLGQAVTFGGPAVLFGYPIPTVGYANDNQYGVGTAFQVYSTPSQQRPFNSLATFLPSSADPTDIKDYIPSTAGAMGYSGADANVALFILDNGNGGVSLIGTFTP